MSCCSGVATAFALKRGGMRGLRGSCHRKRSAPYFCSVLAHTWDLSVCAAWSFHCQVYLARFRLCPFAVYSETRSGGSEFCICLHRVPRLMRARPFQLCLHDRSSLTFASAPFPGVSRHPSLCPFRAPSRSCAALHLWHRSSGRFCAPYVVQRRSEFVHWCPECFSGWNASSAFAATLHCSCSCCDSHS